MIRKLFVSCLAITLVSCAQRSEIQADQFDDDPRLAIISAYEPEFEALIREAKISKIFIINGRSFHVGQLAGNEVVMFMSGISMVNAAMTTQIALDYFNVAGIVFSGIAGGVNPDLNIGDVIVPDQWAQYQEQLFARETDGGWELGWHSDEFSNYGMMFPQQVSLTHKGGKPDSEEKHFWFQVDENMLSIAHQAVDDVQLKECTKLGKCLESEPEVIIGGNGFSGSTFVDNAEYRDWVWEIFQASALDMESASVAHVAYANAVPFIVFRSLSDLAGGGDGANEITTFFQLASDNSAEVVMAFLNAWSNQ